MGLLRFRSVINPSPKVESGSKAHPHLPHGGMLLLRSSSTDGNKAAWPVGLRFSLVCWPLFTPIQTAWHQSPSLYTGERGKSGHTAQRGAAGSPGSARRALSGTDGVISPRGPQGARSDAGVRLSRALGFACALCTPGAGYLNDNGTRGKLGGEIFLCLHGLLLAAAVQQPSSPPLSISFPLSWKD